ncbi:GntR family transcriptional regulator [Salipaludibacillus neizhouensis]|uniref:GntR family transcriptional regulator n=1 Tax=Salipaludibacillus neizhouensis TaxID=885475 RepID=A0A3A9K2E8_9BACI|nr:GntR family transcriptional regulator [Salipaludibacillus neizhouensis]RKL66509.1 GntR family transcriptional regulator [Salipaludibacillus neizhouensis]
MVKINPIKRITITEQIMEQMASWITTNQLKAGEKLPNERTLAEEFGVNRGRIREGLRALALIGLITIKPGEGSFVNKQESTIPAETIGWMYYKEVNNLEEVYAARKLIESEVYFEASQNMINNDIIKLEGILNKLNDNSENNNTFQQLLDEFDLHMGHCSSNRIYSKLMQTIVHLRNESMTKILNVPGARTNSIECRKKLMQAITDRDNQKIKQAIELNFSRAKQFYMNVD